MAERRAPAPALARFQACSGALQAGEERLADLLDACQGAGVAQFERLQQLPAAAGFRPLSGPLSGLATGDAPPAASAAPAQDAERRSNARAARITPFSPGSSQPTPPAAPSLATPLTTPASAGLANTRPAALKNAPGTATAGFFDARTTPPEPASAPSASVTGALADASAARVQDAGALITALLQRHPAPRTSAKLRGIGAAEPAPLRPTGHAEGTNTGAAAARPGSQPGPLHAPGFGATQDRVAQRGEAFERAPRPAPPADRLSHGDFFAADKVAAARAASAPGQVSALASGLAAPHGTQRGALLEDAAADGARLLRSGDEALRTLVAPLFIRAVPFAMPSSAMPSATPHADLATGAATRSVAPPVLRAPSRLLAAAQRGDSPGSAGKAPAGPSAAAPVPSATSASPLDTAADLAGGLDRLLREQAWLRGVDLT